MHFLFPESAGARARVAGKPAHEFFKRYGAQVPAEDWNEPGTKQGVYMIGPDAEYLEGAHAVSGNAAGLRKRLETALARWKKLRKEKGYANDPVPSVTSGPPPWVEAKPVVFRVFLRDLPRKKGDRSGRRFKKSDRGGPWMSFTKWAWNVNWIGFDDAAPFVTKRKAPKPIDDATVRRICRRVLVDNVRGQTGRWKPEDVKEAVLTKRRVEQKDGRWTIEYSGHAVMESAKQSYRPTLYGRAVWDSRKKRFDRFELVAIGDRKGAGTFNQRARDPGPAPMGIALVGWARPDAQ